MLTAGDKSNPPLVLLHGWGAGLAFFGRNISGLAPYYRLYLLDWPGFGASSRPHHPLSLSVSGAESYFLDAFDAWVKHMQKTEPTFDRFHLVAHSMGAYLATVYALRSPQHLLTLTLASPVGLPRAPSQKIPRGSLIRRFLFRMVFRLWDLGFTPQYLMRLGGTSFGRALARRIIEPRFQMESHSAKEALVDYFYHISAADPAGEHSLSTILQSGAYARDPLCDRMDALKVPTVFLYGELDWMNYRYAKSISERMAVPTSVHIVEGAGHHLYFDNATAFTQIILKSCRSSSESHDAVVCEGSPIAPVTCSQSEHGQQELQPASQKDHLIAPFPA